MRSWLFPCFLLLLPSLTLASFGDEEEAFQICLEKQKQVLCEPSAPPISWTLRLMQWNCEDEAKYQCMFQRVEERLEVGLPILQYYGKWPFYRILGMQEPASVLFSFFNGFAHYVHLREVLKIPSYYPYRHLLIMYVCVGVNVWFWSMVFHSRDTPLTEKLDYFSASFSVLYVLYVALIRTKEISQLNRQIILALVLLPFFLLHISYLTFYEFNYDYNLIANLVVFLTHHLIWASWYLRRKQQHAIYLMLSILGLCFAASLEIFDFPPLGFLVDAHSLWHASTIPFVPLWYRFWLRDVTWFSKTKE